jgi:branched-chain amino acid transport system ATP-binding protein
MLAAARALLTNPELLLMDEPSEGLAPRIVREIGRIIDVLKASGTSILLVEQQVSFAMRHADRIFIMSKGQIVYECTADELAQRPEVKARYLGVT